MGTRLFFVVLMLSSFSAEGREPYRLPVGERISTAQGIRQAYTFDEMKILLKMDVDLEFYDKEFPKYREIVETKTKIEIAQKQVIESKNKQIEILTQDKDRLYSKWSEENKLRHEAENKPKYGNWIAWGLATVASVAAITVGILYAVDHK